MNAQKLAKKVLELLGPNGEHWTKRALARNADGVEVSVSSPEAVSFCLSGACMRVSSFDALTLADAIRKTMNFALSMPRFNDSSDWSRVKTALTLVAGETLQEDNDVEGTAEQLTDAS